MTNDAFTSEMETEQNNFPDNMISSVETIKLEDNSSVHNQDASELNRSSNENSGWKKVDIGQTEFELEEVINNSTEDSDVPKSSEIKSLPKASPPQMDHSKLNEISSVDDIKHMCVERREPNGTTYFVEVDLVQTTENDMKNEEVLQNGENIDESAEELEKNIVERVLSQTDIEMRPTSEPKLIILAVSPEFEDSDSEEEEEKEVRVIVHASNEQSSIYEQSDSTSFQSSIPSESLMTPIDSSIPYESTTPFESTTPTASSVPYEHSTSFELLTPSQTRTSPGVIRPVGASENSKQSPNFQIGVYEALPRQKLLYENDKERMAFKMRLENLFGQNDETASLNRAKSNFSSPITPHSQRLSTLHHSISAPESLLNETITNAPVKVVPSKIPIPPAFNQELYDTVALRNRKAFSSASNVIDVNGTTNDHVPVESVNKKGNLSRTKAHENLAELMAENDAPPAEVVLREASTSAPNIKQKLEEIFSKGRTTTQLDESVDLEANRNSNNENMRRSKRLEPFDTVRKQKMLFSDVLKSIGPDIHSNLHPIHTTAAIDIQQTQRRESLD